MKRLLCLIAVAVVATLASFDLPFLGGGPTLRGLDSGTIGWIDGGPVLTWVEASGDELVVHAIYLGGPGLYYLEHTAFPAPTAENPGQTLTTSWLGPDDDGDGFPDVHTIVTIKEPGQPTDDWLKEHATAVYEAKGGPLPPELSTLGDLIPGAGADWLFFHSLLDAAG